MAKREHTISKTSKEIPMCMAVLTATTKPIGVTTDKYFLDTALTAVQRWRTEDEILNLIRSIRWSVLPIAIKESPQVENQYKMAFVQLTESTECLYHSARK